MENLANVGGNFSGRATGRLLAGLVMLQLSMGVTMAAWNSTALGSHAAGAGGGWELLASLALQIGLWIWFACCYRRERLATATHLAELVARNASLEQQLLENARTLYQSQQQFALLMRCFPVGIFRTDSSGNCVYVNERYCAIEGITQEEANGHGWTRALHPEDRSRVIEHWQRAVTSGSEFLMEYRLQPRSGRTAWVMTSAVCLRDEAGTVTGFLGNVTDITERKLLEEQVRQSQKMDSIGRLAGGIAHDFNNLITIILGNAELAIADLPPDQQQLADEIDTISEAAQRAATLTRQLLAFSRKQLLEPKPLRIGRVVTGIEKMLARLIGEHIKLITHLHPLEWQVMADPGQIEQIIMNLAVNARDAMRQGGTLRIESTNVELNEAYVQRHPNVPPGDYVQLSVSDTGCGIAEELLPMVFEPFFTTKKAGEGTGMGLATVFGIVSQSNGHVTVSSQPGKGTTFNIYLPRWAGGSEETPAQREDVPHEVHGELILLTEDEDDVRQLARRILEDEGYRVIEASSGFRALELAAEYGDSIDLLVTDVVMPVISGRQLAEQLATVLPRLKVLYMSGYTAEMIDSGDVVEDGIRFLHKPFTRGSLLQKVRAAMHASSENALITSS